ncbi:MAG TPA: efflux RND transporter periplasmic adaptor subunit, partial [Candidatus Wallbacteria bacterium]|nr:efflux RND transporter periplasmic adaptor subunit [Candidatus Wallbacteria bacterium]
EYLIKVSEQNAEQARIGVDTIKNDLQKAIVKTVIGGVVLTRYHDEGSFVQPGIALFDIGDMSTAYIKAEVLVDDMSKVRVGQKVIITGDAIDNKKYTGEVYFIAPRAFMKVSSLGVEQQKIDVRIKYDLKNLDLKPGYELDANIVTLEKPASLTVAYKAVFESDGKNRIFVIKNGTLELRNVATGIENDENIEIISGAVEGEKIVIDPPNNLKPGIKINL